MNVTYKNLNKQNEVTGSCHYLEIKLESNKDLKIIIDCGATQDNTISFSKLYNINARKPLIDFSKVDYVILSHFHNDHVGSLGRLPSLDFNGKILATQLTVELAGINLRDAANLHIKEIDNQNKKERNKKNSRYDFIPLYTPKSVEDILDDMQGYSYYQKVYLNDNVVLRFIPSGHVSGASMIELTITEGENIKKLLFTGDTSAMKTIPFTQKPNFEDNEKYYAIFSESTYGDRLIEKSNPIEKLHEYVLDTCIKNTSTLLIPSFAMNRSTNIAYYLKLAYEKYPELNNIPIYMASPMMVKTHRILGKDNSFEFYDDEWKEYKDLFQWDKIKYIENFKKVQEQLLTKEPKIIIAASGMLLSGYANYLMQQYLPKKDNMLLLCGYCAEGTPSRILYEGIQKSITVIDEDGKKKKVPIRANIEMLDGMSSHADYKDVIEMFNKFEKKKLKKIIITHGNKEAKEFFKQQLQKNFNSEIIIPNYGDKIKII